MNAVVQEERTGCGIASVAAIAGVSYRRAKTAAAALGISAKDDRLWSDTIPVRRLLEEFGMRPAHSPRPFRSWSALPDCALLAVKWHREAGRPFWHWVVFVRERGLSYVLDSNQSLKVHVRTDFGRMKPKWSLAVKTKR
ncbi:MAG TPA: hypothetical protein VLE03_02070 [Nitrospiraceae bacterium]|nr:hypothetical protein [Nitrospiraceae bacterium]